MAWDLIFCTLHFLIFDLNFQISSQYDKRDGYHQEIHIAMRNVYSTI